MVEIVAATNDGRTVVYAGAGENGAKIGNIGCAPFAVAARVVNTVDGWETLRRRLIHPSLGIKGVAPK